MQILLNYFLVPLLNVAIMFWEERRLFWEGNTPSVLWPLPTAPGIYPPRYPLSTPWLLDLPELLPIKYDIRWRRMLLWTNESPVRVYTYAQMYIHTCTCTCTQ